jgi:hypothetical protein
VVDIVATHYFARLVLKPLIVLLNRENNCHKIELFLEVDLKQGTVIPSYFKLEAGVKAWGGGL